LQARALIQQGPFAAAPAPGYIAAMATDRAGLLGRLDELGSAHTTCEHTPVDTVERRSGITVVTRFIEACGHRPRIIDLDATGVAVD
jgi:hypothetical protein